MKSPRIPENPIIYIIEDDTSFAGCVARYVSREPVDVHVFSNVLDAVSSIDHFFPSLIFLDILLTGPDGFTLLNELASYTDTSRIPVVIMSSIDFSGQDLSPYGVVATLHKDSLTPQEVISYVRKYSH